MIKAHIHPEDGAFEFWCPACNDAHRITITGRGEGGWNFDGGLHNPTITGTTGSIRVSYLLYGPEKLPFHLYEGDFDALDYGPDSVDVTSAMCHCYVTEGRIRYCADSTHGMAGQTIEMVDWEKATQNYRFK